jgi:hypothetical protein
MTNKTQTLSVMRERLRLMGEMVIWDRLIKFVMMMIIVIGGGFLEEFGGRRAGPVGRREFGRCGRGGDRACRRAI